MAIIDVVKYDGAQDIYAWKYPSDELGTWTQLIVNESQEAVLFKGGQALDLFGPGRHTLNTANVPFLSRLISLPTGGRTPFTAEVWYVNKIHALDVKWGTPKPIQVQDPSFKVFVPVRAHGQFGMQVVDSRKFLVKLVGTMSVFEKNAIKQHFQGAVITRAKDLIATYLLRNKVGILDIHAYLDELSEQCQENLQKVFDDFGIRIHNFYVNSINIPEADPSVIQLKAALAKRAEMDILGYTYQQERSFDTLETAAGNEGWGSAGLMGAGMGLGMGVGLGGAMGGAMGEIAGQVQTEQQKACPSCNSNNPSTSKFCAVCGGSLEDNNTQQETIPCDKCGNPMPRHAKFCLHCGDKYDPCPSCGWDLDAQASVCPKCGTQRPSLCSSCGFAMTSDSKFCPDCGLKNS